MKKIYLFMVSIACTWLFLILSVTYVEGQPLQLSSITGDLLHAKSGSGFIGVLYTKSGNICYNEVDSNGNWGNEASLGAGTEGRLAIDGAGNPHVVFSASGKIVYLTHNGSEWNDPVYIESNFTGTCSKPDIDVDGNQNAHITYTDTRGNIGDYYENPDIMYAVNSSGTFVKSIIFQGWGEFYGGSDRYQEFFNKGSYICVDTNGNFFVLSHKYQYQTWMGGSDRQYSLVVGSNQGSGGTDITSSDVFSVHGMSYNGTHPVALYRHSAFKVSELSLSGSTITFSNNQDITASSVSSVVSTGTDIVVGGINSGKMLTKFNNLYHTYPDIVVKGSEVSVVKLGDAYWTVYTDNSDNKVKFREVAEPLSFTAYSFTQQTGPALLDGQAATINAEVQGGTGLAGLIANFTTTTDVTSVKVAAAEQTSGTTTNDFGSVVTYTLSDGVSTREWYVTVTAEQLIYAISTSASPAAGGTTTGDGNYDRGTSVTVNAVPNQGYGFVHWKESGTVVSTNPTYSFTAEADRTLEAVFGPLYTLTIHTAGNGSVKVNNQLYSEVMEVVSGSIVNLEASAGTEYHFTGWSGDLVSTDNPVSVTMTGNKTITANFAINQYTLTILTSGNGSVKVDGTAYSTVLTYDSGTEVVLEAIASTENHFTGWSGGLVSTDNPASVTMTGNKTITANFAINRYTLTILTIGAGSVKVEDATYMDALTFDSGAEVDLEAIASAEYHFTGWSGDLVSVDNPVSVTMTGNKTITANFAINRYTLTILTSGNGSVVVDGTAYSTVLTYDSGTEVDLEAIAATEHHFAGWTGDLVSVDNPASLTMTGNKTITATFAINRYTLTIVTSGNGSVEVDGVPYTTVLTYDSGTEVDLEAIAASEHHLSAWSGDLVSTDNPATISMTGNKTITATFAINRYTLTIVTSGNGSVKVDGAVYTSVLTYESGTEVALEAFAGPEYHFTGWSGSLVSADNPVSVIMTGNRTITADFAINRYTLTIVTSGNGSVKVDGVPYSTVLTFDSGTNLELEAIAASEHHLTAWSGDLESTDNPATVTMTGNKTITATFAINRYTLTILPSGNGAVEVDGAAYTSVLTYESGAEVKLEAFAGSEYHFTGWSGGLVSADNPVMVTMTGNMVITANFAINRYTLTIATSGSGSVMVNDAAYTDVLTFDSGTEVDLEAIAGTEYHFTGWSGDLVTTENPASIIIDGNKSVTASFAINRYTLTIVTSGPGTIKVGDATYTDVLTFDSGTEVDLEAIAGMEYHFSGWSGSLVSTLNPATVTMTGNKTITATFAINRYTLTIITSGSGSVMVNDAVYADVLSFDSGTEVDLEAIAGTEFNFSNWGGDLVSAGNPATITMTGNKTITATFAIKKYILTIITSGQGSVKINSAAYTDVLTFDSGTEVDLLAIAGTEYHFSEWSGDLVSTGNPASIIMTGNKSITANFAINRYKLNVIISGNGSVKVNGETFTDELTYDSGTLISLEAFADAEYNFISWAGGLVSIQNPVTFTITGDKTITARFTGDTTIGPEVVCHPKTVYIEQNGHYKFTRQDLIEMTAGTEDNQTPYTELIIAANPDIFTCADVGKNISVTVSVTDGDGNSTVCQTVVTVYDFYVPQVFCKDITLYLDENGMAYLDAADLHADAYDVCGIQSVEVGKEWYSCNDLGKSSFWVTVSDNNQNSVTCTNTVTVLDLLPPRFEAVNDLTVIAEQGKCMVQVDYPSVQAYDNCKLDKLYMIKGQGPDGEFGIGTSVETWVAVDLSGNSDTLTFTITVFPFYSPPFVDPISDVMVDEGTEWIEVPMTGLTDGSACSEDEMSFLLVSSGTDLVKNYQVENAFADAGILRIMLLEGKSGLSNLTLTITNKQSGKSFTTTFKLTVRKTNRAPFLVQQVENINIKTGVSLKQRFNSAKGVIFDDHDHDDQIILSLQMEQGGSLPTWLHFRNDTLFANPGETDTGCISLKLVASDLAGSTSNTTFTLCVSSVTGIKTQTMENLKMYPNPSTGKLFIELPGVRTGNVNITVRNLLGQVVFRNTYETETLIGLNLEGNVSGIYLISVKTGESDVTRRIILRNEK